jgi:Leucine-rich repeat (LRR) protein
VFVTNEARHAAQEKFSGLFTFEFLLDVFPESHLHLLEEIRLAHMQINTVTCFNRRHYFEQLVSVDLSNNLLKEFNALLYLPALKCLSLESNRLQSLFSQPVHSYEWPALEQLYLGFNLITNIQSLQLEKFPNLQILSLNGNIIQQVCAVINKLFDTFCIGERTAVNEKTNKVCD